MTKEQEIKLAKDFTKMDFSNPMGWTGYYDTELKELQEAIETVLNMLKEKDEKLEKKNKVIDLIIDEFYQKVKISTNCYIQKTRNIEECLKYKNCKQCIKQYFKRKVEEEK